MGNFLHVPTKQYLQSASPNSLQHPISEYLDDPDMSGVVGVPSQYWTISGDTVSEMSQAEKDAVDAAQVEAQRDATAAQLDAVEDVLRAFALVVLDEINTLRSQHGLADRTIAQLKTGVRNKLGN